MDYDEVDLSLAPYIRAYQNKLPLDKLLVAFKITLEHYNLLNVLENFGGPRWPLMVENHWRKLDFLDAILERNLYEKEEIAELTGFSIPAITWRQCQRRPNLLLQIEQTVLYQHKEYKLAPYQIAAGERISVRTVKKLLRKNRIEEFNPPILLEGWEWTLQHKDRCKLEGVDSKSLVLHFHSLGWTNRAIAEKVECSRSYVSNVLSNAKLKANVEAKDSKREKVITLHGEGLSSRDIAEQLDCNYGFVVGTLFSKGLKANREVSKAKQVLKLHSEGLSNKDIAKQLECSYALVATVLSCNGLKSNREVKESKKEQVLKLHSEGLSNPAIAKQLECSVSYVSSTLSSNGLSANRAESKSEQILKLHSEGLSNRAIAKQLECSYALVTNTLSLEGLSANREVKSVSLSRWQQYRRDKMDIRDIILDCIARGDFSNGVENGINAISVFMGVSKRIITPIVSELLPNVND